ncbi:MAG: ROK family protein [Halobacteriales archaeon]|nr:ROK family protein [Halobacteriales archaeon]
MPATRWPASTPSASGASARWTAPPARSSGPRTSPGVDRIPLQDVLIALLGHPRVYVENDAVAGLVGERAAAEGPATDLVYLTLSTGIGAGVAVDGHVLRGRAGNAAEVGHLVVEPGGRTCGCGGAGHWEAYCSGAAIPGLARDLAEDGVDSSLPIGNEGPPAPDVFAAVGDDPLADRVVGAVQRYNAIGVADLVHAYAPDRIAVGGSVALENPGLVLEPLAAAVDEHTMLAVPTIGPAAHGDDAVLRGALTLAAQGGLER